MNKGIKKTFFKFMDTMPETKFGSWDLYSVMFSKTGVKTLPATLIQYAREYADIAGATLECIKPEESIYKYIPGCKIGDAILGGKE